MDLLSLDPKALQPVVKELNQLLANYHLHYQKLRNFHWNVQGRHFFELHEQFEDMYNVSKTNIDAIAERILTLGERPVSNLSDYLKMSDVSEAKGTYDSPAMVKELLKDYKVLIACKHSALNAADEAGDEGTADLIGGLLAEMEKQGWMLQSWLKG